MIYRCAHNYYPHTSNWVLCLKEEPFLMYAAVDENNPKTGNDRYIGFCADLLYKISLELGFKYRYLRDIYFIDYIYCMYKVYYIIAW